MYALSRVTTGSTAAARFRGVLQGGLDTEPMARELACELRNPRLAA
jgi:hypothetical protein